MKPSSNSLLPKQSVQDISSLMHISTLDDHVYRYSYNLAILDLRAQRKRDDMIYAGRRPVKNQRSAYKCRGLVDRMESGQIQKIAFSTIKMDATPLQNCSPKEIEINCNGQENNCKVQELLSTKKICVNECEDKTKDAEESLETDTTRASPVLFTEEKCITKNYGEEEDFNCRILPPIEKFRRAARVLGVCLPPKELYCLQRRNGVCDGNSLDHRTLLRILNKRF